MRDFDYIELKVPAKARYISVIRLTVSGIATAMGFKFDEIEDLKIATEEAVMKVVQQTAKETDGAELIIGCGAYVDKMVYCSQISDLIAAIIIYFCGFVLFFKHVMRSRIQKSQDKKKNAAEKKGGE